MSIVVMAESGHVDVSSTVVRASVGESFLLFRINERNVAHIHLTTVMVVLNILFNSPKAARRRNLSLRKVEFMWMELALARDLEIECGGLQSDFI